MAGGRRGCTRRRRTRTVKVRTAMSRPFPTGQIDTGQKIRTESGQQTDTVPQTPTTIFRKIRTKTRQGQDTDSAVRRRLGCSVVLNALQDENEIF